MKNKIAKILALLFLLPSLVMAQGGPDCWTGGLMLGSQKYLCSYSANGQTGIQILKVGSDNVVYFGSGGIGVQPNNVYLKARNAAGTANIDVLKVDSTDMTILNANTGKELRLAIAGTNEIFLNTTNFAPIAVAGNALGSAAFPWNQVIQGAIAIDTDVTGLTGPAGYIGARNSSADADQLAFVQYGANTTGNVFRMMKTRATTTDANTIVVSGDQILNINARGADGAAYVNAAAIVMTVDGTPGTNDMPGAIDFQVSPDGSATLASALKLSQDKSALFTGTVRSSATADLGWSVVAGVNAACNTTCTSACVFGFELSAGATAPTLQNCAYATSDVCLCAGAS